MDHFYSAHELSSGSSNTLRQYTNIISIRDLLIYRGSRKDRFTIGNRFLLAGSRRPSLASVHSSTSSARSYSARRLERERNDKEQRQALQELRLARSREQQEIAQQIVAPTPSPRTPHSTDELLPSVEEGKEVFYNEVSKFLQPG